MFCTACAAPIGPTARACPACGCVLRRAVATAPAVPRSHWMPALHLLPALAILLAFGSWGVTDLRDDRAAAADFRAGDQALAEGRLLDAAARFRAAGDYADAPARLRDAEAAIAPLAQRYDEGAAALRAGDLDAAIALLLPVAALLPDYEDVTALLEEARARRIDKLRDDARRAYAAEDWLRAERLFTALGAELPDDQEVAVALAELRRDHSLVAYTLLGALELAPAGGNPVTVSDALPATWPVWSPDRTRIAFVSPGDQRNGYDRALYVINPDGSGLRRIAGDPAQWRAPVWSPDGTKIAFEVTRATPEHDGNRPTVMVADLASGTVRDVIDPALPNASSPTWSPTGDRLAFVVRAVDHVESDSWAPEEVLRVDRSNVYVLTLADGSLQAIGGEALPEPWRIAWSPAGEDLLVYARADGTSFSQGAIYRVDARTAAVTVVDATNVDVSMPVWSPDGRYFAYVFRATSVRVVGIDGPAYALATDINLEGAIAWSPSGDRLIAAGAPGIGLAAVAEIGPTDGSIAAVPLVWDASGGDAGPPTWSGGAAAPAIDDRMGTALDRPTPPAEPA